MKRLMNKKILAGAVSLILLFIFLMPVLTNAALINCSLSTSTGIINMPGQPPVVGGACDFTDFIALINNIINWIISIAGVIFTISAIYGGFLYMTSGTSLGDKEKAKSILYSTLLGFVIILCAWLIVYTILTYLTKPSSLILRFLK